MGLDVFAANAPGEELGFWDRRAFRKAEVELAGGMYSGDPGSFRGKLYADLVHHVTGVWLYDRWIEPETVREMANTFARCDPEQVVRGVDSAYDHTEHEVLQLGAFLGVCARRNLGLAAGGDADLAVFFTRLVAPAACQVTHKMVYERRVE